MDKKIAFLVVLLFSAFAKDCLAAPSTNQLKRYEPPKYTLSDFDRDAILNVVLEFLNEHEELLRSPITDKHMEEIVERARRNIRPSVRFRFGRRSDPAMSSAFHKGIYRKIYDDFGYPGESNYQDSAMYPIESTFYQNPAVRLNNIFKESKHPNEVIMHSA